MIFHCHRVMKVLLTTGLAASLACIASAVEVKVEAVVLDLPNALADKLVEQGRSGDAEPWKAVVSPDGSPKEGSGAEMVSRFDLTDFAEGKAKQEIKHDEEGGLQSNYHYSIDAKDPASSRRVVVIWIGPKVQGEAKKVTSSLRFQLCSPLSATWTFSGRYRTAEKSRIVLEKASTLPDFEKAGSKWMGFRLLKREKPVEKKKAKLDGKSFTADQDETMRLEWRFRDEPSVELSCNGSKNPAAQVQAVALDKEQIDGTHYFNAWFKRADDHYICRFLENEPLESKGKKRVSLSTDFSVFPDKAEPTPLAMRLPAHQTVTTFRGNVGEGDAQKSKISAEWIGD